MPIFPRFSLLFACAPLVFAQPELLHLGVRSALESTNYNRVVQLPNGDQLLLGTRSFTNQNPANLQIALAPVGPASVGFSLRTDHGNDVPKAAAVDPSGNIWIVGKTDADDFNLVNPIVSQKAPYGTAGFAMEIDSNSGQVIFATYLCGQPRSNPLVPGLLYYTEVTAVTIDSSGNVYVGGSTDDPGFPTTPGAYLTQGGGADGFGNTVFFSYAVKISPAGKLIYSTKLVTGLSGCQGGSACIFHGSTSADVESLAVDRTGAVTVAGVKGGAASVALGYILRLTPDGSQLSWSAPVGAGFGSIDTLRMAQDTAGIIDLFGRYAPVKSPVTPNVPPLLGIPGLFAAKLSSDGSTMIYSTDLGQAPDANAAGIALDNSGNPYLRRYELLSPVSGPGRRAESRLRFCAAPGQFRLESASALSVPVGGGVGAPGIRLDRPPSAARFYRFSISRASELHV